jgi:hypothetical protein
VGVRAENRCLGLGQWLKQQEVRNERSTPIAGDMGSKQPANRMAGKQEDMERNAGAGSRFQTSRKDGRR